jgi:hypothetical protein
MASCVDVLWNTNMIPSCTRNTKVFLEDTMSIMKVFMEATMSVMLPHTRFYMRGFGVPLSLQRQNITANTAMYVNLFESFAKEMNFLYFL